MRPGFLAPAPASWLRAGAVESFHLTDVVVWQNEVSGGEEETSSGLMKGLSAGFDS